MENTPVGRTFLNTPINSNVIFTSPPQDYLLPGFDFNGNETFTIDDVLVTVTQSKNIVKTGLVRPQGYTDQSSQQSSSQRNWGYSGTVKEYISKGDYQIRLQGVLTGGDINIYPAQTLEQLTEYLEYPGSFAIAGKFVNFFDFVQVVVNDYNFAEQRGYETQIPFTINLLSDDYIEVKYEPVQSSGNQGVDLVGPAEATA